MKNNKKLTLVFTGGGTGGHIFPGLAVAKSLKKLSLECNLPLRLVWIGNGSRRVMDRAIVTSSPFIDKFIGIPSGKLRRYICVKNFFDLFKVLAGFIAAFFVLLKLRPVAVFSKGGYVSVPPCLAAAFLKIKVFTHECDFNPGLATRINSKFAKGVFLTYEETKQYFPPSKQSLLTVTGNPIREEFYFANPLEGLNFLGIDKAHKKPILLVLGGSLGAAQLNSLVQENLSWLTEHFIVVHQTGTASKVSSPIQDGANKNPPQESTLKTSSNPATPFNGANNDTFFSAPNSKNKTPSSSFCITTGNNLDALNTPATLSTPNTKDKNFSATPSSIGTDNNLGGPKDFEETAKSNFADYHSYDFIKSQMPDVLSAADLVMSRAGASTIWESAALKKPMLLIPLCGTGTRGDQVLNAEHFASLGCALTLVGEAATSENVKAALQKLLDKAFANKMTSALNTLIATPKPCDTIAIILLDAIKKNADK